MLSVGSGKACGTKNACIGIGGPLGWEMLDLTTLESHADGTFGPRKLRVFHRSSGRPVGAICHGVIALARAKTSDGLSVLHGVKTTCLPKYMERLAFYLTFWKLGRYYRTYPAYVEDEVRAALGSAEDFRRGPINLGKRGTAENHDATFVIEDGRYVSARWPGDAYLFAKRFIACLPRVDNEESIEERSL